MQYKTLFNEGKIHQLEELWGVERGVIFQTADRFFTENKRYQTNA